jgi:hypothetical protein
MIRDVTADVEARDLLDSRLADLLGTDGCVVCGYRRRSAERYISAILGEMVNDRRFRADLDAARGFCVEHTHAVVRATRREAGGTVAAAILFGAISALRSSELRDAMRERGRSRAKRLDDTRRVPRCPVCAEVATAEGNAVARLAERATRRDWADALGSAALCLEHVAMIAAEADSDAWQPIGERHMARIEELVARLRSFAHHSSHDRRHLVTDEERRSADEAAALLGGAPPRED